MRLRRSVLLPLTLAIGLVPATGSTQGQELARLVPTAGQVSPLQLAGPVESYSAESLWERINGEAELYRTFGLTEAAMAYFEDPKDADRGMEMSLFRVSHPLGAYGLFATFRGSRAATLGLGNGGFADEYQVLFWHGNLFVLLHSFGTDATRADDLRRTGAAIANALGTPPLPPPILTRFAGAVDPNSIEYHPDHLFARTALPAGLSGTTADGKVLFVATATHEEPAKLSAYLESLAEKKTLSSREFQGVTGRDPNLGPVAIAVRDGRLVGLRGSMPEAELADLLASLTRALKAP